MAKLLDGHVQGDGVALDHRSARWRLCGSGVRAFVSGVGVVVRPVRLFPAVGLPLGEPLCREFLPFVLGFLRLLLVEMDFDDLQKSCQILL